MQNSEAVVVLQQTVTKVKKLHGECPAANRTNEAQPPPILARDAALKLAILPPNLGQAWLVGLRFDRSILSLLDAWNVHNMWEAKCQGFCTMRIFDPGEERLWMTWCGFFFFRVSVSEPCNKHVLHIISHFAPAT